MDGILKPEPFNRASFVDMKRILNIAVALLVSGSAMALKAAESYNLAGVSANQMHFNTTEDGLSDSGSFFGFGVNYLHGFGLTEKLPLYLEVGGAMKFMFYSDHVKEFIFSSDQPVLQAVNRRRIQTVTLSVPVNLAYKWNINEKWSIVPFAGVDLKSHLSGWFTDIVRDENYGDTRECGNLFSKKYMDGAQWRHFQLGWNIGARAEYRRVFASLSYGTDFIRLQDHGGSRMSTQNIALTLGYKF